MSVTDAGADPRAPCGHEIGADDPVYLGTRPGTTATASVLFSDEAVDSVPLSGSRGLLARFGAL
jgi:hypothetical protein